ncbi:MAG: DUF4190 domain-containing protein [Pontiellaceae bacterium]|nr:DUF4190 domain-containing protein [Pontiellaceae bacterium]MBN2783552.1 DUF4190 domain-containing protein [Pontiellaceae bacterium]
METRKSTGQSIASLILGIFALFPFGPLTGIPAIICGHVAQSRIRKDPQHLTGGGKAVAGLVMGYISLVFALPIMAAIVIPMLSANPQRAMITEAQAGCGMISAALRMEHVINGSLDGIEKPLDLTGIEEGDLDGTYFNADSYVFGSLEDPDNYSITATGIEGGRAEGIVVVMTAYGGRIDWQY